MLVYGSGRNTGCISYIYQADKIGKVYTVGNIGYGTGERDRSSDLLPESMGELLDGLWLGSGWGRRFLKKPPSPTRTCGVPF